MEGTVFAVGDVNESRTPLTSKGDGHLIRKLLTGHVFELIEKACGCPAVEATAIHVGRAIACCHTDQQLLDWVIAVVLLGQ